MSVSNPSQGTHFSDGVRVGPILGSTFIAGENVFSPSIVVPSPVDQLPPGIFTTPMSLLDIVPFKVDTAVLMDPFIVPAPASYLPLKTTSGNSIRVVSYQGIQNVIQLDCARNLTFTGGAGTVETDLYIFGWDQYGLPMVEVLNGPSGATTTVGKKAFLYIRAIYAQLATVGTLSVGIGNVFGLPFLIPHTTYMFFVPSGTVEEGDQKPASDSTGDVRGTFTPTSAADGIIRLTINFYNASGDARNYNSTNNGNRLLVSDPLETINGSPNIIVYAPDHQLIENENVSMSGIPDFNGILASQSNITAPVHIITSDKFSYQSNGVGNATDIGGGGTIFMSPYYGNLYKTSVGRFGVPQYNIPLF